MSDALEKEIDAIREVLSALEPLDGTARRSVLEYVIKRLQIGIAAGSAPAAPSGAAPHVVEPPPTEPATSSAEPVHIETLKNEKSPRSANEMASLVAYYLSHVAPQDKRKGTVNTQDIETYFKIAKFPLPRQPRVTLQNARNAGYFDSVGDGEYRLNPVGYNLVAHSMPRGSRKSAPARKKKSTRKKRAPRKKSPSRGRKKRGK